MSQSQSIKKIEPYTPSSKEIRFWQRKSVRNTVHAVLVYSLLIGIGILIMMPLSWMLTAALRGQGEPVYTIPTAWFPTESFHFENFWTVLTNENYPLWRPALNTMMLIALNITGVLISNTLVAYAFARLDFPYKEFLTSSSLGSICAPSLKIWTKPH